MKNVGRVKLFCIKKMSNGKWDLFEIIVGEKEQQAAVTKYRGMGYDVLVR